MISFIIPTLNEERVIEKILKNLSEYSGSKEIIISDGKSSDKTVEIARRYTPLVYTYEGTARQSIGGGRNLGAQHAKGDYLLFLDADMHIPDPNKFLSEAEQLFKDNQKLVGLTVRIRVFPELETWGDKIMSYYTDIINYFSNNIIHAGGAGGEFQMIRHNAFKKIKGYNENIVAGEDYELFQRLAKIGETKFTNKLTIYHTGRRAHIIGWPKLFALWVLNGVSVFLFKKSYSKEWKPLR